MAIPATPSNFWLQTGNGQALVSWDIVTGATSYSVQRSTDGVTYTTIHSPTANSYLDDTVVLGTQYYYQIASVNSSGTSGYTTPQSCVPCPTGEMSLGEIRVRAQQRADRLNSNFVTLPEWNAFINNSLYELYDLLVTAYEDYFMASPLIITTDGTSTSYALPNGTNNSAAAPFYKLLGLDLAIGSANNAWVTIDKFNFADRNKYVYPNAGGTIYGVNNMQYRVMGSNLQFIPTPVANQQIRVWYIPRLPQLLQDNDITTTGISGWLEMVIIDAAIKALQKEESDVSVLAAQKQAIIERIQDSAINRDAGRPDTISDVRTNGGFQGPWNGRGW